MNIEQATSKVIDNFAKANMPVRKPVKKVNEASLTHVLGNISKGMLGVSACRHSWVQYMKKRLGDKTKALTKNELHRFETNNYWNRKKTAELKADLDRLGIGYILKNGGYKEDAKTETGEKIKVDVFERTFICQPGGRDGMTFDELLKTVADLGRKYDQESILVCPPGGTPFYMSTKPGQHRWDDPEADVDDGGSLLEFPNGVAVNDLDQEAFTAMNKVKKWPDKIRDKDTNKWYPSPRRFTLK